ncbi:hypothetical protein BLNAU_4400 [Blattamonas nauphoetae]|uniref:Uncharacterized protein n=1 Tax=Blattamonas nauphoetae TaxID=2049346 RepID=A0ABQ9Y9U3_9EUKA|nr:hypothetical protein BLNAU_4400 [Blattamonas nauphoetae]
MSSLQRTSDPFSASSSLAHQTSSTHPLLGSPFGGNIPQNIKQDTNHPNVKSPTHKKSKQTTKHDDSSNSEDTADIKEPKHLSPRQRIQATSKPKSKPKGLDNFFKVKTSPKTGVKAPASLRPQSPPPKQRQIAYLSSPILLPLQTLTDKQTLFSHTPQFLPKRTYTFPRLSAVNPSRSSLLVVLFDNPDIFFQNERSFPQALSELLETSRVPIIISTDSAPLFLIEGHKNQRILALQQRRKILEQEMRKQELLIELQFTQKVERESLALTPLAASESEQTQHELSNPEQQSQFDENEKNSADDYSLSERERDAADSSLDSFSDDETSQDPSPKKASRKKRQILSDDDDDNDIHFDVGKKQKGGIEKKNRSKSTENRKEKIGKRTAKQKKKGADVGVSSITKWFGKKTETEQHSSHDLSPKSHEPPQILSPKASRADPIPIQRSSEHSAPEPLQTPSTSRLSQLPIIQPLSARTNSLPLQPPPQHLRQLPSIQPLSHPSVIQPNRLQTFSPLLPFNPAGLPPLPPLSTLSPPPSTDTLSPLAMSKHSRPSSVSISFDFGIEHGILVEQKRDPLREALKMLVIICLAEGIVFSEDSDTLKFSLTSLQSLLMSTTMAPISLLNKLPVLSSSFSRPSRSLASQYEQHSEQPVSLVPLSSKRILSNSIVPSFDDERHILEKDDTLSSSHQIFNVDECFASLLSVSEDVASPISGIRNDCSAFSHNQLFSVATDLNSTFAIHASSLLLPFQSGNLPADDELSLLHALSKANALVSDASHLLDTLHTSTFHHPSFIHHNHHLESADTLNNNPPAKKSSTSTQLTFSSFRDGHFNSEKDTTDTSHESWSEQLFEGIEEIENRDDFDVDENVLNEECGDCQNDLLFQIPQDSSTSSLDHHVSNSDSLISVPISFFDSNSTLTSQLINTSSSLLCLYALHTLAGNTANNPLELLCSPLAVSLVSMDYSIRALSHQFMGSSCWNKPSINKITLARITEFYSVPTFIFSSSTCWTICASPSFSLVPHNIGCDVTHIISDDSIVFDASAGGEASHTVVVQVSWISSLFLSGGNSTPF